MIFTPRSLARRYGSAPAKAGRNEWWMLTIGAPTRCQEVADEDLHVAREHDQVEAAGELLEHRRLGLRLRLRRDRHVHERDAEARDVVLDVAVVGQHEPDVGVELAAAPAPQQVEQAVVLARDEDRDALAIGRVGDRPLHRERLGDLRRERPLQLGAAEVEPVEVERHAHEERPAGRVGRVLVGVEDVRAVLEQEARDGRDDARPVGQEISSRATCGGASGASGGAAIALALALVLERRGVPGAVATAERQPALGAVGRDDEEDGEVLVGARLVDDLHELAARRSRVSGRLLGEGLARAGFERRALPAVVGGDSCGELAVDGCEALLERDRAERVAARGHRRAEDREQQQDAEDDQHDDEDRLTRPGS